MRFRFILLISSLLLSFASRASFEKICENIDKVAMFTAQIRNIPWPGVLTTPSGPIPTVLNATIQEESVVLEVCEVYQAAMNAEGVDLVYVAKDAYDRLQTDKMNKTMDVMVTTADLASYISRRKNRRDKAFGVQDAKALNSFLGNMNDIHNRDQKQEDKIWTFTNRRDRQRQMKKIARSASRIEQINSQMACDNIEQEEDITPEMEKKLNTLESKKEELDKDKQFIYKIIVDLGIKFLSMEQHKEYIQDLINVYNYTFYPDHIKRQKEVKVDEVRNVGGKETTQKTTETEDYYEYQVQGTENYYERFDNKWVPVWEGFIKGKMMSTLKHQFGDKRFEVEREFHDLDYECSRFKIARNFDPEDPDYNRKIKAERANCLKNISSRMSGNGGLLGYHLVMLREKLQESAQTDAAINTIKSREFDIHSFRTGEETKYNDFDVVSTKCTTELTATQIQKANTTLKLENVKMRTMIAEGVTKKTAIKKAEMDAEKRREEREQDRREVFKARDERKVKIKHETRILDL